MRMFKVLFSAIVTAMVGIFWLSYFGVLDITQIYINGTYLWPQVIGGYPFRIWFCDLWIVSGYLLRGCIYRKT